MRRLERRDQPTRCKDACERPHSFAASTTPEHDSRNCMSAPRTLTGGRAAHCENCSSRRCCITISQVLRVMVLDPRPLEWRYVLSRIHVTFDSVLAGTMGRVRKIEEAATLSTSRKSSTSRKIKSTLSAELRFAARGDLGFQASWKMKRQMRCARHSTVQYIISWIHPVSLSLYSRGCGHSTCLLFTLVAWCLWQYASKLRYPL